MKIDPLTRNVLVGYGAFCAANWAATYWAARSGSPLLFGSAQLLSLNEKLRPLNLLAHLFDPLAAAQRAQTHAPSSSTPGNGAPKAIGPPQSSGGYYMPPQNFGLNDPTNWDDSK
jgi:hypothetical protein